VKELANDSSQFVRAALAGVVMELAPQLGKQPTIEHLVPVFLNLLRDPYPDVRLNVISKLDQVRHRCKSYIIEAAAALLHCSSHKIGSVTCSRQKCHKPNCQQSSAKGVLPAVCAWCRFG
jgi:hypothetical protein